MRYCIATTTTIYHHSSHSTDIRGIIYLRTLVRPAPTPPPPPPSLRSIKGLAAPRTGVQQNAHNNVCVHHPRMYIYIIIIVFQRLWVRYVKVCVCVNNKNTLYIYIYMYVSSLPPLSAHTTTFTIYTYIYTEQYIPTPVQVSAPV